MAVFQKRTGYCVIGGLGVALSAGYLAMSLRLPFGQLARPGAAVFPILAGIILLLASLAVLWEGRKLDKAETIDLPAGADFWRLLSMIGLLIAYFLVLPHSGQIIGSLLFCIILIRLLSALTWPRIVAYALVMSLTLYVVFVHLLKVPMPRGILAF